MNLLIITHNFPPENAIASLRPYSWAKYWSRMGHDITVLTTQKKSFDYPLTLNVSSIEKDSFKVLEVEYLKNQSKAKNTVDINGIVRAERQAHRYITSLKDWTRNVRRAIGLGALISIRLLWVRPAVKQGMELHQQFPFDCIISTFGPPATHIIARILKGKYPDIFWVADYRDLWNDYDGWDNRRWPFTAIERLIENYCISKANLLSTVSVPLRNILHNRFQKPAITIENGFDLDDLDQYKSDFFKEDDRLRLAYTGKIISKKRDPSSLFQAVKYLSDQGILTQDNFEFLFVGGELGDVPSLVEAFGLGNLVRLSGFVNRKTALSIQSSVSLLVFLDWTDPEVDGILTGKLFEYLYSGTPILGIGSRHASAAGDIIEKSGCGVYLGKDVNAIIQVLTDFVNGKPFPYSPKIEVLEKFDRKKLAHKMLDKITQSLL